jgi:hypothetical protein
LIIYRDDSGAILDKKSIQDTVSQGLEVVVHRYNNYYKCWVDMHLREETIRPKLSQYASSVTTKCHLNI